MPRRDAPLLVDSAKRSPLADKQAWRAFRRQGRNNTVLAAVINAIIDALAGLGVSQNEMPATPERIWRSIRAATAGEL
jgi:hypothetical protein